MPIELPGYEAVFPDAVYDRSATMTALDDFQAPVRRIIILGRYTDPTENDVVRHLQQRASEVSASLSLILPSYMPLQGRSDVETALMKLPEKIRNDIRTGSEDYISFVRRHTSALPGNDDESPRRYLSALFGILAQRTIEASIEAGTLKGPEWYLGALLDDDNRKIGLGKRWDMKLLYDDTLPDREELDVLLKHRTHGSRTLDISSINYPTEEVREVIDALYGGLRKREMIDQLPDSSYKILEEVSLEPMAALHEMARRSVIEAMAAKTRRRGPEAPEVFH